MPHWLLCCHCPQSNTRGGRVRTLPHILDNKETEIKGIEARVKVMVEDKVEVEDEVKGEEPNTPIKDKRTTQAF
jgi:hypothetical protein